jgi:RNA polymerase sigma-70 factor (ECF subfamily)
VSPKEELVALMNRYEQPLSGYLLVLLADRDAVRDCAQETFLRAYEHLKKGRTVNSQWLYKVSRNQAVDHLRHRRRVVTQPEMLENIESASVGEEPARITEVRSTLARLSPDDREILYLFVVDRFGTAQIASMLGARPGAIRVRLTRARERFRAIYRGET